MSEPGALCVGAQRSPGALCWARRSLYRPLRSLYRAPPRSLCRGPALSVLGPGALCIRPRALCVGPALSVSGPDGFCVGLRRSLCRGPGFVVLCVRICVGSRRSRLGPLCIGSRRSLAVCVRPQRCLCRGSVSGPALRRSLCWAPLSVSAPPLSRCLCVAPSSGPRVHPQASFDPRATHPPPARIQLRPIRTHPIPRLRSTSAGPQLRSADPRATLPVCGLSDPRATVRAPISSPIRVPLIRPQLRSACHAEPPIRSRVRPACHPSSPTSHQLRSVCHPSGVWSAGPQLRSACHPSSPARSIFPGENPKPYCLGDKDIKI